MSISTFLRYARAIGGVPHLELELDGLRFALQDDEVRPAGRPVNGTCLTRR